MKTLALLIILSALFISTSLTQIQPTFSEIVDTTAATTSWDSVWVGPPGWVKYVTVTNYSASVYLYVALENDTTNGQKTIIFLKPNATKTWSNGLARSRRFIRTKASSGTVSRYVVSEY